MIKDHLEPGDRFVVDSSTNANRWMVMQVKEINGEGKDAIVTYEYAISDSFLKNGNFKEPKTKESTCRMWWVENMCTVIHCKNFINKKLNAPRTFSGDAQGSDGR